MCTQYVREDSVKPHRAFVRSYACRRIPRWPTRSELPFSPPGGRTVVLTEVAWEHIVSHHKEMARHERTVVETVTHPMDCQPDPRPGRERFINEGVGPSRYLTVVVDFEGERGEVVTAFGHRNPR